MHVLSVIAVFAISAGILLAAQSGCIGATLAGTDYSYNTPDTDLSEHAPVQAVTAGERMPGLIVVCQIADTFVDMFFTGVLDAAYAVHGVLSLTAVGNIADTVSLKLDGVNDIATFVPQPQYAFAQTPPADAFVTTWTVSADQSITINFVGSGMNISWGDGTTETGIDRSRTHTYTDAGNYTVSVTGGLTGLTLDRPPDSIGFPGPVPELASIDQWGGISWTNMSNAFAGASNMTYSATGTPDLSLVTDMSSMFEAATAFDGDLSSWDVSSVTNMNEMFAVATSFDQPLNAWDVSSVRNMSYMFNVATSFNQPLNDWDVSSVTDMDYMFLAATSFNQTLGTWDVSSVTDMDYMFSNAFAFNRSLGTWDVSSVINMNYMFAGAGAFNQPLNDWDVSSVTDMSSMFAAATSFNQTLGTWDVSSVTDMDYMFSNAFAFNRSLNDWDVSSVANMNKMFTVATSFNQPLNTWDVSSVTYMSAMFEGATSFNQPLNTWDVSSVTDMSVMFYNTTSFNRPLNDWDVSSVTDMFHMFDGATSFDQPLSSWDVSSVIDMDEMFLGATSFDQDLSGWYVVQDLPPVLTANAMFSIRAQNSYLDGLVSTYSVDDIRFVMDGKILSLNSTNLPSAGMYPLNITAPAVLGEPDAGDEGHTRTLIVTVKGGEHLPFITTWRTTLPSQVITINFVGSGMNISWGDGATETNVSGTQSHTYATASDYEVSVTGGLTGLTLDRPDDFVGRLVPELASIDQWGGISWTNMSNAFAGASNMVYIATDTPDLSLVTDMSFMFESAIAFDGDLSSWDVSSVTDMSSMFAGANTFNQLLNTWDVSLVTEMNGMFSFATSFNQPLNDWDVSSVTYMVGMFFDADSFNQPLNDWDVSSVSTMHNMFFDADSFNQPLNDWDVSSVRIMKSMFQSADSFNQPLNTWDVSKVTNMGGMFFIAHAFNQPLNDWDVSSVMNMGYTFSDASSFNQPLNSWDVSSVTDMGGMFLGATSFNQDLSSWYITPDSAVLITDRSRTLTVMPLSPYIGEQSLGYTVNNTQFAMNGRMLSLNSANTPTAGIYYLAISATTVLDEPNAGTHTRTVTITVRDTPITPFITTWRTDSANQTITVPVGGSTARYSIDWGDNSPAVTGITGDSTHTYREAGIHTVSISGNFERIHLDGQQPNAGRLISIEQWGDMYWISMSGAFDGAYNMVYNAVAAPDLGLVSDMSRMFAGATIFDGDISGWDVSTVRDMSGMFYSAAAFDGEISDWDVSAVRNMNHMFARATSFDQPLKAWDVSSVSDMGGMFTGASFFNHDLKAWDVSAATDMGGMFTGAASFDQDLSDWYVTLDGPAVIIPGYPRSPAVLPLSPYLDGRLHAYSVNDDNTQFVMDGRTILLADPDNPPTADNYPLAITVAAVLGEPNTGSHTGNFEITVRAPVIEPFITVWRTSAPNQSVTIPGTGHGPVCNIDWGDGTAIENGVACHRTHTYAAAGNYRVSVSGGLERIGIDGRQPYADRLISIAQWGDTYWTSMRDAFRGASNMGYPATDTPNLSRVTGMSGMFAEAGAFNGDISDWDVSSVTDMNRMFSRANSFNQPLDDWDVSKVTDMGGMFEGTPFNWPLSSWNVSSVITMRNMFYVATVFVQSLNDWDVSNVTDMYRMFSYSGIQQDLDRWDVSKVTNMRQMFDWAASFHGDISGWNVSSVTDMNSMFSDATSFNSYISGWDVSSVTDMTDMFSSSIFLSSFEQNLGRWYVTVMPGDLRIASVDVPGVLGPISAQNAVLDGHSPVYGIGKGGESDRFGITDGNILNMTSVATQSTYTVNVTASGPRVFENGSNWHMLNVKVTGLNNLPVAEAGPDLSVDEGDSIALQGSGSDDDDDDHLTYSWSEHDLLTFDNRTSATPEVTASPVTANTPITLTLTVSDGTDSATDTMVLTVQNLNHLPVAEAGPDLSVVERGSIALQGSGSDDDGDQLTYSWSEHNLLTFDNRTSATPEVTASPVTANTPITLTLTVSDGTDSATDTMVLTVQNLNHLPVAEAGPDLSVVERGSIALQGSGSDDDGDQLTYSWSEHNLLTFDNRTSATPEVTASSVTANEEITLTLTVDDGIASETDTMVLTITNLNHPPVVEAGPDQTVKEGAQVSMPWTATDSDGDALAYSWSQNPSLPAISLSSPDSSPTTFTAPAVDANTDFTFTLTVITGTHTVEDSLTVTVRNNHPPSADAGPDMSVDEGGSVALQGSGSDDDGDQLTYSWSEHDLLTFDNRTSATPEVTASSVTANEEITLTLTVDDGTASETDTMVLTITNLNHPPVVEAGPDQTVKEGAQVSMPWTATDPDGDALTYSWSQNPSLPAISLNNPDSSPTTFTAPAVDADTDFTFTLTVITGTHTVEDSLTVTVRNNHPPSADAGPDMSVDEGGSVVLQGSGSDDDDADDDLTYLWSQDSLLTFDDINSATPEVTASSVTANTTITLTLSVSDGIDSDMDTMVLTIRNMTSDNLRPTISVGPDQTVKEGAQVSMPWTATDPDGDALTYSWSQNPSLPAISLNNPDSSPTTFTAPAVDADTDFTFTLTVITGTHTVEDSLTVTVRNNHPPSADAGPDMSVDEGGSVVLQGSGSDDDDADDDLTYLWSQDSLLTFDDINSATPEVTASSVTANTTITLTLSVSDGIDSDMDTMVLTIRNMTSDNLRPTISVGPDQTVKEGAQVSMPWTATDPDGDALTYSWSQNPSLPAISLNNPDSSPTTFTAPAVDADTDFTFTLTVITGTHTVEDSLTVTVRNNHPPSADAGPDMSVDEGGSVVLQGSGSDDDDADDDLTYLWSQDSLLTFDDINSATPEVTASSVTANTTITLTLSVSDGIDSDMDTMVLTIRNMTSDNLRPTISVGPDQTVKEGAQVSMPWTATDPDGDALTYSWSQNPSLPAISLNNPDSSPTMFTAPAVDADTDFTFTLTVITGTHTVEDSLTVTVRNNHPPSADAGPDMSVDEGGSVVLQGSGSDDDDADDDLTYLWSQDSLLTFDDINSATPEVTASSVTANTTITLTLSVSDGIDSDMDTMVLTIRNMTSDNLRPTISVGPDQTVKEGAQVSMPWTATDPDGDALTYSWSQNPSLPAISLNNPDSSPTTFTAPAVDADTDFTFTLTVITGTHTVEDSLTVTVRNNHPPSADAGPDKEVDEGTTVTLSGTASDPDRDPLTHVWERISGSPVTLTDGDTLQPQFAAPRVTSDEQIVFRLNATDDAGKSAEDTVTITVRDVPISVSSVTYNPGNGHLTITFNQDIGPSDPDYSAMHIRSTGSDSGGIALSDVSDTSHSGRTVTATLDSGQQEEYGDLESAQLDIAGGAVTDADGVPIIQMPDIPISDVSRKKSSSSKAPIVHINALGQARIVDIPPHIAEQVASHDASDPLEPVMPDDAFDLPLVIDGRGYLLDDLINTLVLQTVMTGDGPAIITFTVYTQKDLAYFALYLNLKDENTDYADSDTYITYKDDGTTVVTDPHGYIGDDTTITVTQEDDQISEKKTVRIIVEFEEPMGPTNMVAYMWNTDRKATFVRIIDAFEMVVAAPQELEMQEADPEPAVPDSEMPADPEPAVPDSGLPADPEPVPRDTPWPDDYDDAQVLTLIRMWSGFESESITDAQLIDALGLTDHLGSDLPDWMMTELGVLVARGDVTVGEFMPALRYVLEHA